MIIMALINLPGGCWIDIPSKGYKIDYGEKDGTVLERGISDNRVVELLRDFDDDEPYIYSVEEDSR